tara:strand:- start:747 stop:950 length:204 start_codon:yes stop_codon:yes gene_type:complete
MIRPWRECSPYGKLLTICCIINCIVSIELALAGYWLAVFTMFSAAFCGMATYSPKCTKVCVSNNDEH